MTDNNNGKIKPSHTQRTALVYVRQSSTSQIENNKESTARQYALATRARELGWPAERVTIIDEDLGISGASSVNRTGFTRLITDVALGRVGIVLGLEVSRLARNNADWYRLIELCSVTDTLLGDSDGLYHSALLNDRIILGVKGTMSEMELHTLRARLEGGVRNKAARGELERGLPVGLVWGERDGEVLIDPDEAASNAIRTVFERFAEFGSARKVWLWFRVEGLPFPLRQYPKHPIRWIAPSYHAIYQVLSNPLYAGAYVYGRTRLERYVDEAGVVRKRIRHLPVEEWAVFLVNHHVGFIDWETYQANQLRLAQNTHPVRHEAGGGAVREGTALLQGIAVCGNCGRKLRTHYRGKYSTPGYHCAGKTLVEGRGLYCLNIGGVAIDEAVTNAFLTAVTPATGAAALHAVEQRQANHDAGLAQWRLEVERARYEADKAERRYRAVEPENRLVARGLEKEWESRLREQTAAEAELARRQQQHPRIVERQQLDAIRSLGTDLRKVWGAPQTTNRDRKELLQSLLEEVIITVKRDEYAARLALRWHGGTLTTIDLALPRSKPNRLRTDGDTIDLLRRLATHYPDDMIASILNRQGHTPAKGARFTATQVSSLRYYWKIPRFEPSVAPNDDEVLAIPEAAKALGVNPSTLFRWLRDGFIPGEQLTPGAPWRIRITDKLRALLVDKTPPGYLPMLETTMKLGVTRQTVLQRVKRGELEAVILTQGKRKGLRIKVIDQVPTLFGIDQ